MSLRFCPVAKLEVLTHFKHS